MFKNGRRSETYYMHGAPDERFDAKFSRCADDECWPWLPPLTPHGYGLFYVGRNRRKVGAHVYAWERATGQAVPDGHEIDHTCHNGAGCPPGPCPHRACVNPAHLEAVTQRINTNRSHNSNVVKTHCPRGHEYTSENTRIQVRVGKTGILSEMRSCRECAHQENVARAARRKAARHAAKAGRP